MLPMADKKVALHHLSVTAQMRVKLNRGAQKHFTVLPGTLPLSLAVLFFLLAETRELKLRISKP